MRKAAACVRSCCFRMPVPMRSSRPWYLHMRPFMGFTEAGIDVYFENETPRVGDVAELIAQGKVEKMTADNTCHH